MNLTLERDAYREDGIFSTLLDDKGDTIAKTLEHSYDNLPKVPAGTYTCVRGPHRLHGMTEDFSTFEVTGVEGHAGILFHWGNFNKDSEGCVLVGKEVAIQAAGAWIITASRDTFAAFMALQEGVDEFQLTVVA